MKPRRFVGRKFKLNNPELEKNGYIPRLQVQSMMPDPADREVYLTVNEGAIDVLYSEPGKDTVIGSINYLDLLDKYDAIIPDYIITYNMIKMENMLQPDMYDAIITVNRTYSNQVMVFSLFNFMQNTIKNKNKGPKFIPLCPNNLTDSAYAKIETITNPGYTEEHALVIPWLYTDIRVRSQIISCYYSDHFPYGVMTPDFVMYLFGKDCNRSNIYQKYGWFKKDIDDLNDTPYIYKCLTQLIMEYLNVYIYDHTLGWYLSAHGILDKNCTSNDFIKSCEDTTSPKFHDMVNYVDRYMKLTNSYEGMPIEYPFRKINPHSVQCIKYTNELEYQRLLEQFYPVGRYVLKLYFMHSQDIVLFTYTLLPNSISSPKDMVMSKEELAKFLSVKK